MHIRRTTIRGLILWTLALGVGCAALLNASEAWDTAIRVANTALLLVAPLVASLRQGRGRAAWAGFAIFGWAYLLLSLPAFEHTPSVHPHQTVRAMLVRLNYVREYPPFKTGQIVD